MSYGERVARIRGSAQRRTGNLYDTYFTRRVSVFVTAALAPTGISPNAVSWINLAVGVMVCLLIGLGQGGEVVAGALLIHLYAILDSVDGELARLQDRRSLVGVFLENWSAYLMINGFLIAVGAYLFRRGDGVWPLAVALGIAAFGRSAAPAIRRTLLEAKVASRARSAAPPALASAERGLASRFTKFVEESLLYQTNVWVVLSALVLFESWLPVAPFHSVRIAFSFYAAGAVLKEAGVVALATGTPHLERELARTTGTRD